MYSVTQRISKIKQPRGGYLKPSLMDVTILSDDKLLNAEENIHPTLMGIVVDYLTRCEMGEDPIDAFDVSVAGSILCAKVNKIDNKKEVLNYLTGINGLDDESIINACKMATYDVWFRNPIAAFRAKTAKETKPDKDTIENIRIMVERSISFFDQYGPVKVNGFTFEKDGYSKTVSSGDGDFLTEDTLWDFKVSINNPQTKHTLQLVMYYIMGKHSGKPEFKNISKIGIYNPRLNKVYLYDMTKFPEELIKEIEDEVICY